MKNVMVGMRHWGLVGLLCVLLSAVLVLPQPRPARAWSNDPATNTAICTASGSQMYPQITSDGSGGAIITWEDGLDETDVYAQRVDSGGAVRWIANGVAICVASGIASHARTVPDGLGGAIITWDDNRNGNWDIYAQRVDSSGAVQWTSNGTPICTASGTQSYPQIAPDGSGGAIITWYDNRSGSYHVYAQRVSSSGAVQWTANGIAIDAASGSAYYPRMISDGSGGAIVTWDGNHTGDWVIYAQRVNSSGMLQWTDNGTVICTAAVYEVSPGIVDDGSGGAIIAWNDYRSGNWDVYAQSVNSNGVVQWTGNGLAVCTASGNQWYPQITSDGSNGAVITWTDQRSGSDRDIYAERVDSSGSVQWAANGLAICTASGDQSDPQIAADGTHGAIITWGDQRSGSSTDIYAQRVNSGGAVQWAADGLAVRSGPGGGASPKIVSDGSDGAIMTWYGSCGGYDYNIYAQWVDSNGSLSTDATPPTVNLTSTASSPTRTSPVPVAATFSEPVTGFTIDDIVVANGTAGNFVAVSGTVYTFDVTPSGQGAVTVDVAAGVAADAAGNANTAAAQFSITYDSAAPTVTISSTATSPTGTSPIPVTATFSEPVTGFTTDDIVVASGTAGNFVVASGTVYTFDVTPAGEGSVTVGVAAGVAQDLATNGNSAAAAFSIDYSAADPTPSASPSGSTNWGLIGGIIGAIAVVGVVVGGVVIYRRQA